MQVWKAARANITNLLEMTHDRLRQIDRLLVPMVAYRWSRWPYYEKRARQLDKLQRDLIKLCMKEKKHKEQTKDEFHVQVMQEASRRAKEAGKWSEKWAADVIKWHEHCSRGHGNAWSHQVSEWRSEQWMQARRQYFDRELKEHGTRYTTNTRATRVVPRTRWEEGVLKAKEKLKRIEGSAPADGAGADLGLEQGGSNECCSQAGAAALVS